MSFYSAVMGINSICAFAIALVIFLSRTRQVVHLTYALLTLLIFWWTFCYFIWAFQTDVASASRWLRFLFYPICFVGVAMFHFILIFTGHLKRYGKYLWVGYGLGCLFAGVNARNGFVQGVRPMGPFPFHPVASPWLFVYQVVLLFYVVFGFYVLWVSSRTAPEPARTRLRYFLITGVIAWMGAWTNVCYWYGITQVPPLGNPAITFYLLASAYLIFKHDILGLNLLLKRTFVYALLTLFIALIYAVSIVVSEKLFQHFLGYSSLLGSLLAGALIAVLFNPLRDWTEGFIAQLFFGKDILELSTENLRMKEELLKQDRLKSVALFAAGMAHEIKNPITAIRVFAEYLPKKYEDPEFRGKFARIVRQEAERITGIVEDLLMFSKPSEPRRRACDLPRLLNDLMDLLSGDLLKGRVTAQLDLGPEAAQVYADPDQIKQALLNVMMNGIEAMEPGGGTLTLRTLRSGKSVLILVEDTGCGIPQDKMPHLFDPFFTGKEDGTGLGLAITHSIVEKNGGKIRVESRPGEWTRFTFELPAAGR